MNERGCGCMFLVAVVFAILALFDYLCCYSEPHWETITVKEKSIGISRNASYLIYTEKEVYEIQDLTFIGFFTSSDLYNSIKEGETYRVKVYGARIPEFSSYKNIVKLEKN